LGDSETSWAALAAEQIRAEQRAEASVELLAAALAEAAAPIWRLGDGRGGYVREVLEQAFRSAGLR